MSYDAIYDACHRGDMQAVHALMRDVVDGAHVMIDACRRGDYAVFMCVRNFGFLDRTLNRCAQQACDSKSAPILRELVANHSDMLQIENDLYQRACKSGDDELIDIIEKTRPIDIYHGLYGACEGGHEALFNRFVARGVQNYQRRATAMGYAAIAPHRNIIAALVEQQVDTYELIFNAFQYGHIDLIETYERDPDWITGFDDACTGGQTELAKRIMHHYSTPERIGIPSGFQQAASCGHLDLARYLYEFIPAPNRQIYATYALRDACVNGIDTAVPFLLECGATFDQSDFNQACSRDAPGLVKLLLEKSTVYADEGFTEACHASRAETALCLLSYCTRDTMQRMMFTMCRRGFHVAVAECIRLGCTMCDTDVYVACGKGFIFIFELYIKHMRYKYEYILDCLKVACKYNRPYLVKFILGCINEPPLQIPQVHARRAFKQNWYDLMVVAIRHNPCCATYIAAHQIEPLLNMGIPYHILRQYMKKHRALVARIDAYRAAIMEVCRGVPTAVIETYVYAYAPVPQLHVRPQIIRPWVPRDQLDPLG
jgi:hypothetical protein